MKIKKLSRRRKAAQLVRQRSISRKQAKRRRRKKTFGHYSDFRQRPRSFPHARKLPYEIQPKSASAILNRYARLAGISPATKHTGEWLLQIPTTFSFIDSPNEALAVFRELAAQAVTRQSKGFFLDYSKCKLVDLCAESVASVLIMEVGKRLKLGVRGRLPHDKTQQDIARAAGLPNFLGANLGVPDGFVTLGLIRGRKQKERAEVSSQRELTTTKLTNYINECLKRYRWALSRSGARYVSSIVGEVIGNAEDHSGTLDWWVAAYLHQASDTAYGDCHIAIFTFGKTLYQSMQDLPEGSLLRTRIDALVQEHTRRGWFRRPSWTPENLWTLYALQEGASRYQVSPLRFTDRGQGTADMIQFFQRLGQSKAAQAGPRMCVVSGQTHILFDGKYKIELRSTADGEKRRIIALNKSNDLADPPDEEYVKSLNSPFPGTLISLKFYLDEAHLRSLQGEL